VLSTNADLRKGVAAFTPALMPLIRVVDGVISGGGEAGLYDRKGSMKIIGDG